MAEVLSSLEFIVFCASIALIALLLLLKRIEFSRGRRFGEGIRIYADYGALRVKNVLSHSEEMLENVPWFIMALVRYGIHVGALSFARLARMSAIQAHRLTDLVSHKRSFERRETKSPYLKEVGDFKNGKENTD